MKNRFYKASLTIVLMSLFVACSPKYGCPGNGKNVGAEKYLNGSKVPKAKKFRA